MLLLSAVTIGAALRFHAIGQHSLWNDELFTWSHQKLGVFSAAFWQRAWADVHPPGHALLMAAWCRVFGDTETALRAPSALAGIALVVALFLLCRRIYGELVGGVAAWLGAVSPVFLFYSQEGRAYELVALFSTVSALGLLGLLTRRDAALSRCWRPVLLTGGALALNAYFHYIGLICDFVLLTFGLALCAIRERARMPLMGALAGTTLLLYAPWGPALWDDLKRGGTDHFIQVPDFMMLFALPMSVLPRFVYLLGCMFSACVVVLRPREVEGGRLESELVYGTWLLLVWCIGFVGLMWIKSNLSESIFMQRAVIAGMPAIVAMVAALVYPVRTQRLAVLAWLSIVVSATLWQVYRVEQYTRNRVIDDVRGAVQQGLEWLRMEPALPVIAYAYTPYMVDYYLERSESPSRAVAAVETSAAVLEALEASRAQRAVVLAAHLELTAADLAAIGQKFDILKAVDKKNAAALLLQRR